MCFPSKKQASCVQAVSWSLLHTSALPSVVPRMCFLPETVLSPTHLWACWYHLGQEHCLPTAGLHPPISIQLKHPLLQEALLTLCPLASALGLFPSMVLCVFFTTFNTLV